MSYRSIIPFIFFFFCCVHAFSQTYPATPAGVGSNYQWVAWLTPDRYQPTTGIWTNRITSAVYSGNCGDFNQRSSWSSKTIPVQNVGNNYHPATVFANASSTGWTARNRLLSVSPFKIESSDAFSIIMVYKAFPGGYDWNGNLINFGNNGAWDRENNIEYREYTNSSAGNLVAGWNGCCDSKSLSTFAYGTSHILTYDNANQSGSSIKAYKNGSLVSTVSGGNSNNSSSGNTIMLGASNYDPGGDGERGMNGEIQEVIILKHGRFSIPFMIDQDLLKIHTYLAIKYGIHLATNDNYNISDGTTVWTRETAYNKNIFGIGRDDGFGLYQKQAYSSTNYSFRVFLGSQIRNLNSQNISTIPDKQFVMFADNGLTGSAAINVSASTSYANGPIPTDLNFRTATIWKTQLTGIASKKVSISYGTGYRYCLVSTTDNFDATSTKFYPINEKGIVEIELTTSYKFICLVGNTSSPANITGHLRLWLKAENSVLSLESLSPDDTKSGGKLESYVPASGEESLIEGVAEWKDFMRNITYSFYNKGTNSEYQQMPVYQRSSIEMNFHPAIRFYGNGSVRSSYLRSNNNIMGAAKPPAYTVIALTNNNFSTNPWVYILTFKSQMGSYDGPQFGVTQQGGLGPRGRMRYATGGTTYGSNNGDGGTILGNKSLFEPGSTSISTFMMDVSSQQFTFQFNGAIDLVPVPNIASQISSGAANMADYSIISGGFDEDRTIAGDIAEVIIYDSVLTSSQIDNITSYLALKYGVTLRPNTPIQRHNYKLSNQTSIWDGTQTSGKFVTYYNSISALVRDDASELNNLQSHSTETGPILHLGVAGTKLGGANFQVEELQNNEAVVSGHNNATGFYSKKPAECGNWEYRFQRQWLIHKVSNRPIALLIGGENNLQNNLGSTASPGVKAYYNVLSSNYEVFLLVASSADSLTNGLFKHVIPMNFISNEHQCIYTCDKEDTYVTFAYKQKVKCIGTNDFPYSKTFQWNQYPATNYGTSPGTVSKGAVDLGNGLQVSGSSVIFGSGVRTALYYPRREGQDLQVYRDAGANGSAATVRVDFNSPVTAKFSISGVDEFLRGYEQIVVQGYCGSIPVTPKLEYAGSKANAAFVIAGNVATVNKLGLQGQYAANGKFNVYFDDGVDRIEVLYKITGKNPAPLGWIYVSPITIRPIPLPAPINEDGLSFVKTVLKSELSSCDFVEYSFEISNTNCDDKKAHFSDRLPEGVYWRNMVGLDSVNQLENPSIVISGRNLTIDSLLIPAGKTARFTAQAVIDDQVNFGTKDFANRANITYMRTLNSVNQPRTYASVDKYTLDSTTIFRATWQHRFDTAAVTIVCDKTSYRESEVLTFTYTINNPNSASIDGSIMKIRFNDNFDYLSYNGPTGTHVVIPTPSTMPFIQIAGDNAGSTGFIIPSGISTYTVKFSTPTASDLTWETDEAGHFVKIGDRNIRESFKLQTELTSNSDNSCLIAAFLNSPFEKRVPYCDMDLELPATISNCTYVDLTHDSLRIGVSHIPNGTTYSYHRDINNNNYIDSFEPDFSRPDSVTVSGKYLIRAISCDTIVKPIIVNIKAPTSLLSVLNICQGNAVSFGDTTFLSSTPLGTYYYTKHSTNAAGCDSTAKLELHVWNTASTRLYAAICNGATYNGISPPYTNSIYGEYNYMTSDADTFYYKKELYTTHGCDSTVFLNLTVNRLPNVTIAAPSGTQITCGSDVTVNASGGTTGTYRWADGETSAFKTVSSAGTFIVTFTDSKGCSDTATITITSSTATPVFDITNTTGNDTLTCSRTSIPFQIDIVSNGGSNPTYSWSSTGSSQSINVTNPGSYRVTVTNTDNNCQTSKAFTVYENTNKPEITITNNEYPVTNLLTCLKTTINVTANATGRSGSPYIYDWNGQGSSPNAASNAFNSPLTYTVSVTGRNGCSNTKTVNISQDISQPVIDITNETGVDLLSCALKSIVVRASGAATYSWSGGNSSGANNTISSAGTYYVTGTASNGCGSIQNIVIQIDTVRPQLNISSPYSVLTCSRTEITLTASGGTNYQWSGGGTGGTKIITTPGTHYITATSNTNGCTATTGISITEDKNLPNIDITNNSGTTILTCTTPSISLTASSSTMPVPSLIWNNGLGSSSTVYATQAGSYSVTATGDNGCNRSASIAITENKSTPNVQITNMTNNDTLTCSRTTIRLSASGSGTYAWSTGAITNFIDVTQEGVYSCTVTGSNGCSNSANRTIVRDVTLPTAKITNQTGNDTLTCSRLNINVIAEGGASYSWSGGSFTPTRTLSASGVYPVTVTGNNGCKAEASITIYQNTTPPNVSISKSPNTDVLNCTTTSIALTANNSVSGQNPTFLWNSNGETTPTINVTNSGTYIVTVTAHNGCTATKSVDISKNSTVPTINFDVPGSSRELTCSRISITVIASGGDSYVWSGGSSTNTPTNSFTSPGIYYVTVSSANGCSATNSIEITQDITPPTAVGIIPPTGELTCSQTFITVTASGGNSYVWSGGSSTNTPGNTFSVPGTYYVTATATNGCTATASISITQNISTPTIVITPSMGELTCTVTSIPVIASGGISYHWSGGSSLLTDNNTFSAPGPYYVTVTAANGCTASRSITITKNAEIPFISGSSSVCEQGTRLLDVNITGGSWLSLNPSTATVNSTSGVVTGVSQGTVNIKYTATATGCSSEFPITVLPLPQQASAVSTSQATICNGSASILSYTGGSGTLFNWYSESCGRTWVGSGNNLTVNPSGTTTYYGRWENSCGNSDCRGVAITMAMPVHNRITASICRGETYAQNDFNVSSPGVYSKYLTTSRGCDSIVTLNLSYHPDPALNIYNPLPVCPPATINLKAASVTAGTPNFSSLNLSYWNDDQSSSQLVNPEAVNTAGTYYIKAVSTTTNCSKVYPVTVAFHNVPTISGPTNFVIGETGTLTASIPFGAWSCTPANIASISGNGIVTTHFTGIATAVYTTPYGCTATHTINVIVGNCNDFSIVQNLTHTAIHNHDIFAFPAEIEGYSSSTTTTFTCTNYKCVVNNLSVNLTGIEAGKFMLNASQISTDLPLLQSTAFTVSPITGLPEGIYNAEVVITANGSETHRFTVRFKVKNGCNCTE